MAHAINCFMDMVKVNKNLLQNEIHPCCDRLAVRSWGELLMSIATPRTQLMWVDSVSRPISSSRTALLPRFT